MLLLAALLSADAVLTLTTDPPSPPVVVATPLPLTLAQPMTPLVPMGGVQVPPEQVPLAQTVPHWPQCAALFDVLTQLPEHSV